MEAFSDEFNRSRAVWGSETKNGGGGWLDIVRQPTPYSTYCIRIRYLSDCIYHAFSMPALCIIMRLVR